MPENYRDDHKAVLDALLLDMPGVTGGKAFGYPAYKIGGKVFCFVGGDGISIKLPKGHVDALISEGGAFGPFEPVEGTVWKSWVSIDRDTSEDYRGDIDLLEESVSFVAGYPAE